MQCFTDRHCPLTVKPQQGVGLNFPEKRGHPVWEFPTLLSQCDPGARRETDPNADRWVVQERMSRMLEVMSAKKQPTLNEASWFCGSDATTISNVDSKKI